MTGTMPAKPIKPDEVPKYKGELFPPEVFESVNELIVAHSTNKNSRIVIKQKDIVHLIQQKLPITNSEIFNKGYLNFEQVYREAGWHVTYTRPDYTECFDSYFTFEAKK